MLDLQGAPDDTFSSPSIRTRSLNTGNNLVQNPATPARVLDRLADHPNVQVRLSLIANHGTPFVTLARLTTDTDPIVRAAAARRLAG